MNKHEIYTGDKHNLVCTCFQIAWKQKKVEPTFFGITAFSLQVLAVMHCLIDNKTILKEIRVKLDYLSSQRLWRILISHYGSCHIYAGTACILRYAVIETCCYVGFS
jgi:hypothetical protein